MSESKMLQLLDAIAESLDSASGSFDHLKSIIANDHDDLPQMIQLLLKQTGSQMPEGVSLLSLKNSAMLSYINNLILVILANLERVDVDEEQQESFVETKTSVIKNTVVQRVTLERGVKGLENRLNYQLDKMTKLYDRMVDEETKAQEKAQKGEQTQESDDSEADDDSEAEDITSYRPDLASLAASVAKSNKTSSKSSGIGSTSGKPDEKYKPPRIAPQLPPSTAPIDGERAGKSGSRTKKLQSMEEFLNEQSDAPQVIESIGSTILDSGRGGIKTARDKLKELEIQRYEEDNFVRLNPHTIESNKRNKTKRGKNRVDPNVFGGEDFSMFNNHKREITESSTRKRKLLTAWDRAKSKR